MPERTIDLFGALNRIFGSWTWLSGVSLSQMYTMFNRRLCFTMAYQRKGDALRDRDKMNAGSEINVNSEDNNSVIKGDHVLGHFQFQRRKTSVALKYQAGSLITSCIST